jgi:methylenetetrahydrofolate dehydrogenase (NADP+) / methenyltetrahydrofolate cyclohydrolase
VGFDEASEAYVKQKLRAAKQVGIDAKVVKPAAETKESICELISQLNKNSEVHVIIVQLPLPKHL